MTPPLRVAQLSAHLSRAGGGIFTSLCELSRALAAEPGIEVEIFGPEPVAGAADFPPGLPAPHLFPRVGPVGYGYAPALAKGLVAAAPDLVHVHGLWMHPSVAASAYTRETKRPRIVSPHGMLDAWALRNSLWKKRVAAAAFESAHLRGAACLHALCAAEAESMRAYGLRGPVCVIPNGVRPADAPRAPRDQDAQRSLLYLGRLHPKKGLPALLRAWKEAWREPWRLQLTGWDEVGHEEDLLRLVTTLELEKSVSIRGPVFGPQKQVLLQECEGVILPSVSEGLPMVILEAWGTARPVLMTPHCNLPEGFAAGAAMRIEADEESIAQGLAGFFAQTDDERDAMGRRGLNLVQERFNWPGIAAEMKRVYDWVCGRGDQPASVLAP